MSDFKPKFVKPTETLSFLDRNIVDNTTSTSLIETTDFIYNKYHSQSIQQQRQRLPIFNNRNHILYLLEKYQTLILIGETGCGKSTQIPQNYPIERDYHIYNGNTTIIYYKDVTWINCDINPLCDVTVKAVLLDHTNYYLFSPLVTIIDNILQISYIEYITPNTISIFHVFIAILSSKLISSDSLSYRRLGVLLFEFRTLLDDLDGHVARVRKHMKGEHSEIGTLGYYVDGICDAIGTIFLLIGIFVYLKNHPPRRNGGYMQLPTQQVTMLQLNEKNSNDLHHYSHQFYTIYKCKMTSKKVLKKILFLTVQLLLSSMAWNRYIALYQDMLESTQHISIDEYQRQNTIFKSSLFFVISWLWRVINVHNMLHILLLCIFCDRLWELLQHIQFIGFAVLFFVICVTELHVTDVRNFIFYKTIVDNQNKTNI